MNKFIRHTGIRMLAVFLILISPVMFLYLRRDSLFWFENVLLAFKHPEFW